MRRLHLLEIHEQPWCPGVIRDAATSYLGFIATVGRQYDRVTPILRHALDTTGAGRVVDLPTSLNTEHVTRPLERW